jgi:hypothetical protein
VDCGILLMLKLADPNGLVTGCRLEGWKFDLGGGYASVTRPDMLIYFIGIETVSDAFNTLCDSCFYF